MSMTVKLSDAIENELANNEHWHELPLPFEINLALSGGVKGELGIPDVESGYYFFYDRFPEAADPYDLSELNERAASNYTIAVYDADENVMYVAELDT